MNIHTVTPTQARLAQERRERQARILMAASNRDQIEEAKQAAREEAERERAARRHRASEAERKATARHKNLIDSWKLMVSLAEQYQRLIDVSKVSKLQAHRFLATQVQRRLVVTERAYLVETVCAEVAAKYGFSLSDMKSEKRGPLLLLQARYEFWWRSWRETGLSMQAISRIACKDRTTIIHGVQRYTAMQEEVKTGKPAYAIWQARLTRPDMIILEAGTL
jgi:hypothetical protein